MGKKVISNTFTVNTVEDGMSQQQIFYRNQSNQAPATPATSQSDTIPSGWSATPQGVGGVYKYEWVSMRIKSDGVWGAYSTPAVYAYLAEDGTSISIKGAAIDIVQGTYPDVLEPYEQDLSLTSLGDIILFDETEDSTFGPALIKRVQPYVEDEETKHFVVESVTVGDGYLIASKSGQAADEGHLYLATEFDDNSGDYYFWQDCGRIKGEKGDDAVMYVLEPSIPQFNTDQERTKAQVCTVRAYKIEGKTKSAFTGCFEIDSVVPSGMIGGITYSWGNYVSFGTNNDRNATAYSVSLWDKDPRYLTVDEPEPVLLASITIPIAFDGVQGKMGRNLWFAGLWSDVAGQTFSVDDHSAPYVQTGWVDSTQKTPVCKVFIGANGNFTYPSTVAGYENNVSWGAMVSDFEYLITKAVFAALAKLGSWTFNSDYMYSDLGLNHSSQQESAQGNLRYDGIGDSDNTWTPNVSIDAANGRASFGRDKVRFNPDGSGWLANKNIQWDANGNANFNGDVRARMVYNKTVYVDSNRTINPLTDEGGCYTNITLWVWSLTLPSAADFDGIELSFFQPLPTRVTGGMTVKKDPNDIWNGIYYSDDDGYLRSADEVNIIQNQIVTIKSIDNKWHVISGKVTPL